MNKLLAGNKNKQLVVVGAIVLILLIAGGFMFMRQRQSSVQKDGGSGSVLIKNAQTLPTVTSSVLVTLTSDRRKQKVTLTIDSIPSTTSSIEYELVYEHDPTKTDLSEGFGEGRKTDAAIGDIPIDGDRQITREIILGTCSATCTYHTGVNSVKLTLKFNASGGASVFEKEFAI